MNRYIRYLKNYIENIKQKNQWTDKQLIQRFAIREAIVFITCFIFLQIFQVPHASIRSVIIMLLESIPFIGSALYFIPAILFSLVEMQPVIADHLGLLYLYILCIRQVYQPFLTGKRVSIRPILYIALFYLFHFTLKQVGVLFISIFLLIGDLFFSYVDIMRAWKKTERKKKREKSLQSKI